ncbi:DUF416 family protein [Pendulispora rubella]|uniref:DUF416 family protein n=1 Tax=Pendulispora rubella TaxID=2741070 RepID=UPI00374E08EF
MSIENQLQQFPVRLRAAFAACCAERLLPAYHLYCARLKLPRLLEQRLELVWSFVLGTKPAPPASQIQAMFESDSQSLIPPDQRGTEYAQDAAISILYALLSLAPSNPSDVEGPVSAARHVTDALDRYIARHVGIQPDDPKYAEQVTNHEVLLSEVARQRRDLNELQHLLSQKDQWSPTLNTLRDRATTERLYFLGQ